MPGVWGQAAQEELRRRAVALVGEGRSQTEVAGLLDVSRQSVSEWVRAHRLGGDEALAAGRRGRRAGEKTAITPRQQAQIAKAIREKNPDQPRLPGFVDAGAGVRADPPAVWGTGRGEDRGAVSALVGVQPAEARQTCV